MQEGDNDASESEEASALDKSDYKQRGLHKSGKFQLMYSLGHNPQKVCHFLVNITYETARQQR